MLLGMGGISLYEGRASASGSKGNDGWLDDDKVAFAQARKANKPILVDFTGSTWCPACMALHKEVFSTAKFQSYAQKFVLLKIDFPDPVTPPKKGADLVGKYLSGDIGLPTIMVLAPDGKKLGETSGYDGGGPDAFIATINKMAGSRAGAHAKH